MLAINYTGIRKKIDNLRDTFNRRYTGLERKLGVESADILELLLNEIMNLSEKRG